MTKKLTVKLPNVPSWDYSINIGAGLLKNWLPKNHHNIVIITDNTVKKHLGSAFAKHLTRTGYRVLLLSFTAGESSKEIKTKNALEEKMLKNEYGRDTLILALGGGVVGDISGFIAATYMRGIPYIQIPTTLLAMIDSSVGGKTAINNTHGKNLIGAFWHPLAVISDIDTLKTLPEKHIIAGLVEAIKIFLTSSKESFTRTEKNINGLLALKSKSLIELIEDAVRLKAEVVEKDEKEVGLRMILNFGHTIGHALEKLSNYKLLHGYAVAYGILMEAKTSQMIGLLSEKNFIIIENLLGKLGIHAKDLKKYDIKKIIKATISDKKSKAQQARYVLLKDIGSVYEYKENYAHPIPEKIIHEAFIVLTEVK